MIDCWQQVKAGWVTEDKVNDSVLRILTPMFAMGIFDLPNNGTTATNATTEVRLPCRPCSLFSKLLD